MDAGTTTLRQALQGHLFENGFPPDGGLSEKWVIVGFGPIPVCFPNIRARRRTVPYHDLNHVVSGYGHDDLGEAEVGAWELGSGCKRYWVAWVLNWSALPLGWKSPRRVFDAFVRGRRSRNLYDADLEKVMDRPLADVQTELGLATTPRPTPLDLVLFGTLIVLAPVVSLIPGVASLVTSPIWLTRGVHRQSRTVNNQPGGAPSPTTRSAIE